MARGSKAIGDLAKSIMPDRPSEPTPPSSSGPLNTSSTTGSQCRGSVASSSTGIVPSPTGSALRSTGESTSLSIVDQRIRRAMRTQKSDGLDSLVRTVNEWRVSESLTLSIRQCRAVLDKLDGGLVPVHPEKGMVMLEQTLALYGVPEEWDAIAEFYIEVIETLPEDLLASALKHARMNLKWFPKPSELIDPVRDELYRRKGAQSKARFMIEMKQPSRNRMAVKKEPAPAP